MRFVNLIVAIMIIINLFIVDGARILGVFPLPVYSHHIVNKALMNELHSRGHEIVILTAYPMYNSSLVNYTEIDMSSAVAVWKKGFDIHEAKGLSWYTLMPNFFDINKVFCKIMFDLPGIQNLRYMNESFDLVIAGWLLNPCSYGFAYHFSAPIIGLSPLGLLFSGHDSIGNPTHPIYFTEIMNPYLKNPTFWEKLDRLIYYILFTWNWKTTVLPQQDKIARQYFGENMPYLGDLERNVSLVFTALKTDHYSVVPKVPALIELGAIHIQQVKPLPKDLKEYLDGAPEGAIYFSLGTNVQSDKMSAESRNMFLDVFSQLIEFRILWKWDGDDLLNLPSNVKIGKWFSQLDVLAHPKMKAFIYQGGLQSTEEAIKAQVPVFGLPFAVDQDLNLRRIVDYGAGIKMDFNTLTKDAFLGALKALIYDPNYKINMKRLSDISRDEPQTPMERAIWWTEYVIRHKGAAHMRSSRMDLTWYEYLLLDVVAFIIFAFIVIVWVIYYICSRILRQYVFYAKEKFKLQ